MYLIIKYETRYWLNCLVSKSTGNYTLDKEEEFICGMWKHNQYIPQTRSLL